MDRLHKSTDKSSYNSPLVKIFNIVTERGFALSQLESPEPDGEL